MNQSWWQEAVTHFGFISGAQELTMEFTVTLILLNILISFVRVLFEYIIFGSVRSLSSQSVPN